MKRRRHTPDQIVRKIAEADKLLGQGKDHREGLSSPRGHRVDLPPLAEPIRRNEGLRRQASEDVRGCAYVTPVGRHTW
jgi:hypothetical protein